MVIEDNTPWQNKTYLKLWERGQEGKLGKNTLANGKKRMEGKITVIRKCQPYTDNKTARPPVTILL